MTRRLIAVLALTTALCICLCIPGCSKNSVDDDVEDDGIAPAIVTDLAAASFTDSSVTLTWTASGDDSTSGTASSYDLRISASSINWGNFDSASQVTGLPAPKPAGQTEQFEVRSLKAESTYYFCLKVLDENANYQGISNCVSATCINDFAVTIPDAGLLAAIRERLSKPSGDILKSDLLGLTDLPAADHSIADLTGLEYCVHMTMLNIINNSVSDLSPLSQIHTLTQLQAGQNDISNIAPLANLTALTWLRLDANQVSNLAPVSTLTELTDLDLQDNRIVDISPLSGLPALEQLLLSYNFIRDIGPLVDNSGIGGGDVVSLLLNPLAHESIITHIPALRSRGVTVSWVDNTIPPFQVFDLKVDSVTASTVTLSWTAPGEDFNTGTAWLYDLRYSTNQSDLQTWTGGQSATNLPAPDTAGTSQSGTASGLSDDSVYYFAIRTQDNSENWSDVSNIVWAQPFSDVAIVFSDAALESAIRNALAKPAGDIYRSELLALDTLIANDQGISDLTGLENCTNLTYLHLSDNDISQIDQLAGLLGLRDLDLQGNNITDVSPLSSISYLMILQLSDNPLGDLPDVSALNKLFFLSISSAGVSDLQPLTSLTALEYFYAVNNSISNLAPLSSCPHLKHLFVDANSIVDISSISGLLELSNLSLRYNLIEDISPLVDDLGVGEGDQVALESNPLSTESKNVHIPALQARGVTVTY